MHGTCGSHPQLMSVCNQTQVHEVQYQDAHLPSLGGSSIQKRHSSKKAACIRTFTKSNVVSLSDRSAASTRVPCVSLKACSVLHDGLTVLVPNTLKIMGPTKIIL